LKTIFKLISILFLSQLLSCTTCGTKGKPEINDFSLYQGKWYEIARLPNSFEKGLKCITATYTCNSEGMILLTNRGINKDNPEDVRTLKARAWIPDTKHPENLKVQFIWPITKDYWLVHIDRDKGYAIIGTPSRKRLWFLSRGKTIPEPDMTELIGIAVKNGFSSQGLIYVEQSCSE